MLVDYIAYLDQCCTRASRILPDEIADENEIRAGFREQSRFVQRCGIADAGRLEHFGPPLQPVENRLFGWALAVIVGFAEQYVICSGFSGHHGIVPCVQSADAENAIRLQRCKRIFQSFDAGDVRAICARARGEFEMTVKQKCGAGILDNRRNRFGALNHAAFVGGRQLK